MAELVGWRSLYAPGLVKIKWGPAVDHASSSIAWDLSGAIATADSHVPCTDCAGSPWVAASWRQSYHIQAIVRGLIHQMAASRESRGMQRTGVVASAR